jgi:hypothetical protein
VNEFLQTALTFPTVVYSMLLAVSALYWVVASTSLADGDALDVLSGGHGHGHVHVGGHDHVHIGGHDHVHVGAHADGHGHAHGEDATGAAALLARLGLRGIPLMVIATVFSLMGWLGTYFVQLLALPQVPDALRTLTGAAVMVAMVIPATLATSLLLRPVGRRLEKLNAGLSPSLIGRTGTIITPSLSGDYGQASVDDGGAGLILQVRLDAPNALRRGDRIVLIEYLEGQHAYRVVSEQQFLAPAAVPPSPTEVVR